MNLVLSFLSEKVIGNKWDFRVKLKPDKSLDKYKAKVSEKGYN